MAAQFNWLPRVVATPAADNAQGARPDVVFRAGGTLRASAALAVGLLGVGFAPALASLWDIWTGRPEYSHGPVMPLIALFLIWQRKDRLERLAFEGSAWGPALVILAGLLLLIGTRGAVYAVEEYGLVVAIAGLMVALTGWRALRHLVAPLVVLVLMVPLPDFVLSNLSAKLQLVSSVVGVGVIRALGISVFLEGNVIDLGGYRLQVVEACAGLRYLFPLTTVGVLVAYFYKGALWKRLAICVASVPLAVLMNSLRIGAVGVLVDRWGTSLAEGFVHDFQGWMVFMLSASLLVALAAALNTLGPARRRWREAFGIDWPTAPPANAERRLRPTPRSFVVAVAALAVVALAATLMPRREEGHPPRTSFENFPLELGEWRGVPERLASDALDVLQVDDYLLADYFDAGRHQVNLFLSYYGTQRERRIVHSPRACLPGGGWRIEELTQVAIPGLGLGTNRVVISKGDERALMYYWFDQRGRHLTRELAVKWYLFWDSVTTQRSDGGMVRLVTPIARGEDPGVADARLARFAARIAPQLQRYVPR